MHFEHFRNRWFHYLLLADTAGTLFMTRWVVQDAILSCNLGHTILSAWLDLYMNYDIAIWGAISIGFLIKLAMIDVDRVLNAHLILQIHDELIFEVPDNEVESLAPKVKKLMEGVMQLKIPLVVDISIGKNWGEC